MKALLFLLICVSVAKSFSISRSPTRFHLASSISQNQGGLVSPGFNSLVATNQFRGGQTELTSTRSISAEDSKSDSTDDGEKKPGKYSRKLTNILNNVKAAPFALAVAALAIGYKIGVKSVSTVSETASKAASGSTRSAARQYPVVAIILFIVAVRDTWSLIPNWAKKNIPFVGSSLSEDDVDPDDLTSFPAMSMKLRKLFQQTKDKLKSKDGSEIETPGFVFLALVRLMGQLKQKLAQNRDKQYEESGTEVENPRDVLKGIYDYLEYADWSYNEFEEGNSLKKSLASQGYSLLRHDATALPGHVAHYVAVCPERKEALIVIKGTSNFEDMLTDCCGNAVKHEFEDGPFVTGGRTEVSCHEGVLLSSTRLADDLQTFMEKVLIPSGYKLTVVGHSLGAGVAVLFSMILKSRLETLREDEGKLIKVIAFASPPILDYEAASTCKAFVSTFVNNADIVPRASLSNLVVLMDLMKTVDKRLDEKGLNPRGVASAAKYIKMLTKDDHKDSIMNASEIQESINAAVEKMDVDDPEHLFVAGRVIHMYDQWTKEGYGNKSDYEDEEDESKIVDTAEKVYESDGIAKSLRIIEIDDRMMSDHMPAGYRASIRALLKKSKEETKTSSEPEASSEKTDTLESSTGEAEAELAN